MSDYYMQEFHKNLGRAKYYEEQKNYHQAIKEYSSVISNIKSIFWLDEQSTPGQYPEDKEKISFSLNLGFLLNAVAVCYYNTAQPTKAGVFAKDVKEIIEILAQYQNSFEVEHLKLYEALRENYAITEILTKNLNEIQNDELSDETFKTIRESLNQMCKLNISLLPPRDANSSGGCFIATAAYSTSTHPDLDTFRNFRDEKLLTNAVGKQLVNLYYQISPSIAKYVEKQPAIKSFVRKQLERLANWMRN